MKKRILKKPLEKMFQKVFLSKMFQKHSQINDEKPNRTRETYVLMEIRK